MIALPGVVDAAPLVSLYDGILSRPSEIGVRRLGTPSFEWVPADQRAIVDIAAYVSGASGKAMLVTGAHTQELTDADDLDPSGTTWAWVGASGTVDADAATAPDGGDADKVNFAAATGSRLSQTITAASLIDDVNYTLSVWAKAESGTEEFRLRATDKSGTEKQAGFTATTTWQRFDFTFNVGSDASPSDVTCAMRNASDGAARSVLFWLPNLTQDAYPAPTIRGSTPATLAATQWDVPEVAEILSGKWTVDAYPLYATGEQGPVANRVVVGTDSYIDGSLQYRSSVAVLRRPNEPQLSRTVSYSRLQKHTYIVDQTVASFTVSGFDSGDGTDTGPVDTWNSSRIGIGSQAVDGNNPFNGLITAIERA